MYVPPIDSVLPVQLPSETVRARVEFLINDDEIVVELTNKPMAKTHNYDLGEFVKCRRTRDPIFGESWVAGEKIPVRPEEMIVEPAPKPVRERVASLGLK